LNTKKPELTEEEEARAGTSRKKEGGWAAGEDTKRGRAGRRKEAGQLVKIPSELSISTVGASDELNLTE
jgi:hypothetical protein